MKYSKNIHEHKNNISVVSKNMKKLILGMVFAVGIITISNAKTTTTILKEDCFKSFTMCDLWAGDSYECFVGCMNDEGC